jgi:hypothetical protein
MKNLILLLFTIIFITGCEDIEDNNPAFQANIDDVFFKASDSKAARRTQGSYTIQGFTENRFITLKIERSVVGTYSLGETSASFATIEDNNGNIYSTGLEGGSGEINLTFNNTGLRFFNGTFKFLAILPGVDTLVVDRGVFFEVPYDFNINEDDDIPDSNDLFVSKIDGIPFNPFTLTIELINENSTINLIATSPNKKIELNMPIDTSQGNFPLPDDNNEYTASYTQDGSTEGAVSGSIFIIENDIGLRIVRGSFSFETTNHSISLGQFRINY